MLPLGAARRRDGTGAVLPAAAAGACEGSGEYESQGVEAHAYLDGIAIASDEISPGTVGVMPFFERELTAMGMHLNPPGKTVVLAPKGHVPTPEEISILAGVGVHIADEGGMKMVGVPVGSDEFAIESAIGIVRDRGGGTTRADAATNAE